MKHVPRQSAAAVVVVAGAAGMAADAAVVAAAAAGVAATVAVAGAAAIAATVEIAGKKSSESESVAPSSGQGASIPLRESSVVSLRQSFIVAALTSAGSTRLTRLKGSLRIFAARGQDFANGHRVGQ